tara:strand:- start:276 stop:428 length:153 start_codon:yes stop_codon:yes gene_type:complete
MVVDGDGRAIFFSVFVANRLVVVVAAFRRVAVYDGGHTHVPLEMLVVHPS